MPLLMGWATLPTSRDINFLRQRSLGPRYQWLVASTAAPHRVAGG